MNTRQLMDLINNLDITEDNYLIWEEIYNQPYHIFLPIIERLLDGRISIYDFVPRSGVLVKDYEGASVVDDEDHSIDKVVARFIEKVETGDLKTITIPSTYEDDYVRLNSITQHNDANLEDTRIKPELSEYM